jgi:hypothetical protein
VGVRSLHVNHFKHISADFVGCDDNDFSIKGSGRLARRIPRRAKHRQRVSEKTFKKDEWNLSEAAQLGIDPMRPRWYQRTELNLVKARRQHGCETS